MNADHAAEVLRIAGFEGFQGRQGGAVFVGQEHPADTGFEGPGDDLVDVLFEGSVVQVGVGIGKFHRRVFHVFFGAKVAKKSQGASTKDAPCEPTKRGKAGYMSLR